MRTLFSDSVNVFLFSRESPCFEYVCRNRLNHCSVNSEFCPTRERNDKKIVGLNSLSSKYIACKVEQAVNCKINIAERMMMKILV